MAQVSPQILARINNFIEYVEQSGIPIEKAILFGSYANGSANKWRDIDLAIVSSKFEGNRYYDLDKLVDARLKVDSDSHKINYLANDTYYSKKDIIEAAIIKKTEELELQHLKLIQEIEHQEEIIDTLQFAKIMSEFMIVNQNDLLVDLSNELNIPIKNFNELKNYLNKTEFSDDINAIIDKHLNIANQMIDTINKLVDLTKYNESSEFKANIHLEIISLREDISKKIMDINNRIE